MACIKVLKTCSEVFLVTFQEADAGASDDRSSNLGRLADERTDALRYVICRQLPPVQLV